MYLSLRPAEPTRPTTVLYPGAERERRIPRTGQTTTPPWILDASCFSHPHKPIVRTSNHDATSAVSSGTRFARAQPGAGQKLTSAYCDPPGPGEPTGFGEKALCFRYKIPIHPMAARGIWSTSIHLHLQSTKRFLLFFCPRLHTLPQHSKCWLFAL